MSSNRFILLFLGIVFVIIVILSSAKIGGFLRTRFGRFLPVSLQNTSKVTPTPTVITTPTPILTLTPSPVPVSKTNGKIKAAQSDEIPATGPNELVWLVLGSSFFIGISFKKIASFTRE